MYERTNSYVPKRSQAQAEQQRCDRVRVFQLVICMALFLLAAVGNGVCPEKMDQIGAHIRALTTQDMDFREALSNLGGAFITEESSLKQLQEFYIDVFAPAQEDDTQILPAFPTPEPKRILAQEVQNLTSINDQSLLLDHYLYSSYEKNALPLVERSGTIQNTEAKTEAVEQEEAVPAVGTVLLDVQYSGKPLPVNYTMNELSLGALETVTPVLGHLNSEYGYRDHPINGKYLFHGGVDIGGQSGDPIAAFSAGSVEYVGENKSYGLYLQLDHGNGIKSFYAHCKKICVKKGQLVQAGEKIAEVGSTGAATGPHLHLELKCNEWHVNPAYYLEFLNA